MTEKKPPAAKVAGKLQPFRWRRGAWTWENAILWAQEGDPRMLAWMVEEQGVPQEHGKAIAALLIEPPGPMAQWRGAIDPQAAEYIRIEYRKLLKLKGADRAREELGHQFNVSPDVIRDICQRRKTYRTDGGYSREGEER